VDQLAQRTFVRTEAICRVKAAQARAAQCATAFGIQGKGILKRRPAAHTEEFRDQRLRLPQAFSTDGNACDLSQRLGADAAIAGEEK
jgi:hypothetical protein